VKNFDILGGVGYSNMLQIREKGGRVIMKVRERAREFRDQSRER
jgi:hypothetical protein